MNKPTSINKLHLFAIAAGILLVGIFFWSTFSTLAFIGPTASPPGGANGAVGVDASNNVYIGGNLNVSGTVISAGGLGGSMISAGNVTAGVFGSNSLGGSYAFPLAGSLGVNTSTANNLPQSLSVYGGGYFSGNVGVGTTTPGASVSIVGPDTLNTTQALNVGGSSGKGLVVTDAGYVGIGITNPTLPLFIYQNTNNDADIQVQNAYAGKAASIYAIANSNYANLNIQGTSGHWVMGLSGSPNFIIFDAINNVAPFQIETGATANAIHIKSGGNVGIGTTTPATALDVAGDITDENLVSSPFLTTSATGKLQAGVVLGAANGGTATTTPVGANAFLTASSTINIVIANATTTAPSYTEASWDYKRIITKITCVDATGATTLEFYKTSGFTSQTKTSEIVSSLTCGTAGNSTTAFTTPTLAAGEALFVNVISTTGVPTETSVEINTYRQ